MRVSVAMCVSFFCVAGFAHGQEGIERVVEEIVVEAGPLAEVFSITDAEIAAAFQEIDEGGVAERKIAATKLQSLGARAHYLNRTVTDDLFDASVNDRILALRQLTEYVGLVAPYAEDLYEAFLDEAEPEVRWLYAAIFEEVLHLVMDAGPGVDAALNSDNTQLRMAATQLWRELDVPEARNSLRVLGILSQSPDLSAEFQSFFSGLRHTMILHAGRFSGLDADGDEDYISGITEMLRRIVNSADRRLDDLTQILPIQGSGSISDSRLRREINGQLIDILAEPNTADEAVRRYLRQQFDNEAIVAEELSKLMFSSSEAIAWNAADNLRRVEQITDVVRENANRAIMTLPLDRLPADLFEFARSLKLNRGRILADSLQRLGEQTDQESKLRYIDLIGQFGGNDAQALDVLARLLGDTQYRDRAASALQSASRHTDDIQGFGDGQVDSIRQRLEYDILSNDYNEDIARVYSDIGSDDTVLVTQLAERIAQGGENQAQLHNDYLKFAYLATDPLQTKAVATYALAYVFEADGESLTGAMELLRKALALNLIGRDELTPLLNANSLSSRLESAALFKHIPADQRPVTQLLDVVEADTRGNLRYSDIFVGVELTDTHLMRLLRIMDQAEYGQAFSSAEILRQHWDETNRSFVQGVEAIIANPEHNNRSAALSLLGDRVKSNPDRVLELAAANIDDRFFNSPGRYLWWLFEESTVSSGAIS